VYKGYWMEESQQNAAKGGRKLLLACGNPLRSDDGAGWKIAEAFEREAASSAVRVIVTQQFTPELVEAIRDADTVVFVDASATTAAGEVTLLQLTPADALPGILTHHLPPPALLALTRELYGTLPGRAFAVTVGAASFELGESLTDAVEAAIPKALDTLRTIFAETE
jgi:hydrogenase maturation protease